MNSIYSQYNVHGALINYYESSEGDDNYCGEEHLSRLYFDKDPYVNSTPKDTQGV